MGGTGDERARAIVDDLATLVPVGATTVLVTHGAFAGRLARLLLGPSAHVSDFGYAEVAELVCHTGDNCGAGQWETVGERFAPAGDAGRGRNA